MESNKSAPRVIEITGDEFREMIQSKDASKINFGSNSRYISAMQLSGATQEGKDLNEAFPISVPSTKYSSTFFQMTSTHLTDEEKTKPTYIVKDYVRLGSDNKDNPITYPCKVIVDGVRFKGAVSLGHVSSEYSINFINCTFDDQFDASLGLDCKSILFEGCTFSGTFSNLKVNSDKAEYKKCTIGKIEIFSNPLHKSKNLIFKESNIELLTLKGEYYENISLDSNNIKNLKIDSSEYSASQQKILKPVTEFQCIDIKFTENEEGDYRLFDINTTAIKISGTLEKASMLFKDMKVKDLHFSEFTNLGKLDLHKITVTHGGSIKVISSILGKSNFSDVKFSDTNICQIYYSNLTEIITTNTDFPSRIIGRDKHDHSEVRETYRQLKFAASKQGDRIRELIYESLEFKAHFNGLSWKKDFIDKFILLTNSLSNAHGQNWIMPLISLLLINLILFVCINYSLGKQYHFGIPSSAEIAQFFNFSLNPLHDFDKIFLESKENLIYSFGKGRTLDVFAKIASGYFLFQFLRAFRKFYK